MPNTSEFCPLCQIRILAFALIANLGTINNPHLFSHSELARHRDLGLNKNQPDNNAEELEDNHDEEEVDVADSGQLGKDSPRLRAKCRSGSLFTSLRTPPRANPQNTSLANPQNTSLANQQSSQVLTASGSLTASRRQVVSCVNCNKEFHSSQEKMLHMCNQIVDSDSGPPSISLLAARSQSPSPEIELPSCKDDQHHTNQNMAWDHVVESGKRGKVQEDEGEILEGHSEVAGPSGCQGGQVNVSPADNSSEPFRVAAEKDSEKLELEMDIDPSVHCTRLRVRVPLGKDDQGRSLPLSVSANYTPVTTTTKQKPITDYFGGGKKSVQEEDVEDTLTKSGFEKVVERAKKKGFLAPSFASLEEKENRNSGRVQQKKCPWWKRMKDTNLAVDAFSYGSIPGVSNYLLSHFHYDHYMGMSRKWQGKILCSSITARLAMSKFKLPETHFLTIEPEEERVVDGVMITALDANHCPGSLMFVLRFDFSSFFTPP